MIVTVMGGKNDPEGEGQRYQFQSIGKSAIRAFDIVWDLFSWAMRAQPLMGQPFLSFCNQRVLSYRVLSQAIKLVAREMGVDARRYRTHSLRIGGASMLAVAGVPDYVIQKQGRWKLLAFLEYICLTRSSVELVLAAFVNPCLLTLQSMMSEEFMPASSGRKVSQSSEWGRTFAPSSFGLGLAGASGLIRSGAEGRPRDGYIPWVAVP